MPFKQLLFLGFYLIIIITSCNNNKTEEPLSHVPSSDSVVFNSFPPPPPSFLLKSPSGIRRDSIFNHFVDSLAVNVKFIPCCDFDRADTHLYFDSTGCLIARSMLHLTSGQAVYSTYGICYLIHTAENLSPSLFFTTANGKHYYYDSSKHNLQVLHYDELDYQYDSEEVIPAGIGLSPNVKYALLKIKTSEPICDFVYEHIEKLSDEFAIVTKNQLRGILNTEGKEIIPCAYETFYPQLNSGLIVVERDDKYGLFNTKGEELISCNYDRIAYFEDGSAIVEKDNKFGVLNTKKQKNISCEYEYNYGPLNNKLSIIAREGHFYDGFEIIEKNYFFEGGCEIVMKEGKYGLLDGKGKERIPCIYEDMDDLFDLGLVIIEKNGKYGLFNKKGKEIASCKYDYINVYIEDRFLVLNRQDKEDDPLEFVMIDVTGKEISRQYEYIASFENGFAIAEKKGKQIMLNTKGKEISQYYESIGHFKNGFAITERGGLYGLINKKGKEFIPCKYKNIYLEGHPEKLDSVYRVRVSQDGGKNVKSYDLPQD